MTYRTVNDWLTDPDLSRAERKLIDAARAGRRCILQYPLQKAPDGPNDAHNVRADLLSLLITGGTKDCGLSNFGVKLVGAYITGRLRLTHQAAVGDTSLFYCRFADKPDFRSASFQVLNLTGSHLPGLNAQRVAVTADLFLSQITAAGTVNVNGAKIGGQLSCMGATLNGGGGDALFAQGVRVNADLFLRQITATGTVDLNGAKIEGQLDCKDATFDGNGKTAVNAQDATVGEALIWRGVTVKSGGVQLVAMKVGELWDDVDNWPDKLILDGFTYDRILNASTRAKDRLKWLKKGSCPNGVFTPQPYTQLAKVLRDMGHLAEARKVLIERQKLQAAASRSDAYRNANDIALLRFENPWKDLQHFARWFYDLTFRAVVGYGYDPKRAAIALILLLSLTILVADKTWTEGAFVPNSDVILVSQSWQDAMAHDCIPFTPNCIQNPAQVWSNSPNAGMDWESFNRYGYAADLVIPILNLGQTDAWAPSKDRGDWGYFLWWFRWVLIVAGWIVSALGAAAITGIMQRDKDG